MGRMMGKMFFLVLAAALLTGCGVSNTAAGTVRMARQVGSKYANDDTKYAVSRWRDALFWGSLDAEPDEFENEVYMDISSVQWVTNQWLYYTAYGSGDEERLWRMPIEKTKKGDKLKKDKKEKLLKGDSPSVVYATESYLVLTIGDGDESVRLCRYDLGRGRLTELISGKEFGLFGNLFGDESENPLVMNENLIVEGEEKLFCMNPETGECSVIFSGMQDGVDDYIRSGNILYFLADSTFYRYDSISGETSCLVRREDFAAVAGRLGLGTLTAVYVEEVYREKGKIYYIMKIEWQKGNDGYIYTKDELFCAPEGAPGKLCREDALMDWLDEKGWYEDEEQDAGSRVREHTTFIDDFLDGKVIACYLEPEGRDFIDIEYDPGTERIRVIP